MRRAIAAAMSRSNQDIPHYYLETQVDMTDSLAWLEAENEKRSAKDRILPALAQRNRKTWIDGFFDTVFVFDPVAVEPERRVQGPR